MKRILMLSDPGNVDNVITLQIFDLRFQVDDDRLQILNLVLLSTIGLYAQRQGKRTLLRLVSIPSARRTAHAAE